MKIIVLQGEDTEKSYKRLEKFTTEARNRNWEVTEILPDSPLKATEIVSTPSLFGSERLFILRDYKLLNKNDLKVLQRFDGNFVIYHEGDLPAAFLKMMPQDFKMEKYDLPKIIFTFLDSLYPGNSSQSIKLLHDLVKTEPPELVFFLVSRHIRDLFWVKVDATSTGFPSWKVGKLRSQTSKYSPELLKRILVSLSDIDSLVKSSKTDLLSSLDLLILKYLE